MRGDLSQHVVDLLAEWAPVTVRRMFGGEGLFRDGSMFALIADEVLYLKVDAASAPLFAARDLEPFTYLRKSRPVQLSYRRAPEEALEDPREAAEWAERAWQSAQAGG